MRIIPPTEAATDDLKLDLTKPIIEFDPWPFADESVNLTTPYVSISGEVVESPKYGFWTIDETCRFMGMLTDGRVCVVSCHFVTQLSG